MRIRKGKLLVALGLCMALMFALCACGSTVNDKETTSTTAESSVQNAETEKAENPETDITQGTEAATRQNGTDTAETDATANQPEETEQYNSVLVVYFSHTGTTKGVSEYLHELVGGDLIEIEPVNPYPAGYSDALDPAKQEQRDNARPEIANAIEHFDSYEVIYLGYPIWWGTTPMIINTLLESYDFSGKTVVPYATSGGTGIGQSMNDIRSEIPDADVRDGLLVRNNDDIIPWLQGLGLYE